MNAASDYLCDELFELSGETWKESHMDWNHNKYLVRTSPKYDLGYLMRKLPRSIPSKRYRGHSAWLDLGPNDSVWYAWYFVPTGIRNVESDFGIYADTPEDAAAKLAIELFKAGILKREDVKQ